MDLLYPDAEMEAQIEEARQTILADFSPEERAISAARTDEDFYE
jgi:hypothetical protein